jgi:hypothetical protein
MAHVEQSKALSCKAKPIAFLFKTIKTSEVYKNTLKLRCLSRPSYKITVFSRQKYLKQYLSDQVMNKKCSTNKFSIFFGPFLLAVSARCLSIELILPIVVEPGPQRGGSD